MLRIQARKRVLFLRKGANRSANSEKLTLSFLVHRRVTNIKLPVLPQWISGCCPLSSIYYLSYLFGLMALSFLSLFFSPFVENRFHQSSEGQKGSSKVARRPSWAIPVNKTGVKALERRARAVPNLSVVLEKDKRET